MLMTSWGLALPTPRQGGTARRSGVQERGTHKIIPSPSWFVLSSLGSAICGLLISYELMVATIDESTSQRVSLQILHSRTMVVATTNLQNPALKAIL